MRAADFVSYLPTTTRPQFIERACRTGRASMSLLREAEKCIANQKLFTELNAFITPLQSLGSYADRIRDADIRRENGIQLSNSLSNNRLLTCFDNRNLEIPPRRPPNRHQRQHLHPLSTNNMRLPHAREILQPVRCNGDQIPGECRRNNRRENELG